MIYSTLDIKNELIKNQQEKIDELEMQLNEAIEIIKHQSDFSYHCEDCNNVLDDELDCDCGCSKWEHIAIGFLKKYGVSE